jgi:hypothetical protein
MGPTPNGHRGCQYNVRTDPDLVSHCLVGNRISSDTLAWMESHPLNHSCHRLCARAGVAVKLHLDCQCRAAPLDYRDACFHCFCVPWVNRRQEDVLGTSQK